MTRTVTAVTLSGLLTACTPAAEKVVDETDGTAGPTDGSQGSSSTGSSSGTTGGGESGGSTGSTDDCQEIGATNFGPGPNPGGLIGTPEPALGGPQEDFVQVEFFGSGPGTYDLGAAENSNFSNCEACVAVFVDAEGSGTDFFQVSGSMTIDSFSGGSAFTGSISDVLLVEVTIEQPSSVSTPVPDGMCLRIKSAQFSGE